MKAIILLVISVTLSICVQAQTSYSGSFDNIIGPCAGAYDLVENKAVYASGAATDKDMKLAWPGQIRGNTGV